jgi:hypothetical protein
MSKVSILLFGTVILWAGKPAPMEGMEVISNSVVAASELEFSVSVTSATNFYGSTIAIEAEIRSRSSRPQLVFMPGITVLPIVIPHRTFIEQNPNFESIPTKLQRHSTGVPDMDYVQLEPGDSYKRYFTYTTEAPGSLKLHATYENTNQYGRASTVAWIGANKLELAEIVVLGDERGVDYLIDLLTKGDEASERLYAAVCLRRLNASRSLKALFTAASSDPDINVRIQSIKSIHRLRFGKELYVDLQSNSPSELQEWINSKLLELRDGVK